MMNCGSYENDPIFGYEKKYAAGQPLSMRNSYTGLTIVDATGKNVSDWLLKTVDKKVFTYRRYGGFSIGASVGVNKTRLDQLDLLLGTDLTSEVDRFVRLENAKVWFNNFGLHSSVGYSNALANGLLRQLNSEENVPAGDLGINVISYPYDFTINDIDAAAFQQASTDTIISLCVVFALSFIPASFVVFLIQERACGAKHLQFLSGCHPVVYWVANYSWDMLIFLFPTCLSIVIFLCFQADAYTGPDNIACLILLFLLFGLSVTPLMYPATYIFEKPATAYVALTAFNLFVGINTTIAVTVLMAIIESDPDLTYIYDILDNVFLVFPHFCLGRGLIEMSIQQAYLDAYKELGFEKERNEPILAFRLVGRCCVAMAIEMVVFFALALLCEYNFFCNRKVIKLGKTGEKDTRPSEPDVEEEKARALSDSNTDILKVLSLSKAFKQRGTADKLVAVNRITFSVPKGKELNSYGYGSDLAADTLNFIFFAFLTL